MSLTLIKRFWPLAVVAIVALLSFSAGWKVTAWRYEAKIERINKQHEADVGQAIAAANAECKKNQAITRGVSDELQQKLRTADARHADAIHRLLKHEAAKRLQLAGAAIGHDAGADGDGLPWPDSTDALSLIDLGAAAERQTGQLEACQRFLLEVWASK